MLPAEPKTASIAKSTKANQPFFSKKGEGSFFDQGEPARQSFFNPSARNSNNGNGIVQTKLAVGQPNDKYEKEADEMADKVVQRLVDPLTLEDERTESIQPKCTECQEEDMQKLQTKSDTHGLPVATPNIESSLNASRGGGSPLPARAREQMESSFGTDFSSVRLHTDSAAKQMNKDLHSQAFTHGSDIYFNAGKYDTQSTKGKHLLAHELTHVVQQGKEVTAMNLPTVQKQGIVEGWIAELASLKKKIVSFGKQGVATIALFDDGTGKVKGYQITQNFRLVLDKSADSSKYAFVQWITGEVSQEDKKGNKSYWPANTAGALYGKKSTEPWLFTDWIIDSPDADPRFGSHRGTTVKVPTTDFEDSPGINMSSGAMPVGLRYKVDAKMGIYPWGWPIPKTISDWQTMKPTPFTEIKWGWVVKVEEDQMTLDVNVY